MFSFETISCLAHHRIVAVSIRNTKPQEGQVQFSLSTLLSLLLSSSHLRGLRQYIRVSLRRVRVFVCYSINNGRSSAAKTISEIICERSSVKFGIVEVPFCFHLNFGRESKNKTKRKRWNVFYSLL